MMSVHDTRPLIAHVVYRFDVGGLENGVANLINRLPAAQFRHAVIALTEVTDFRNRITRDDVQFIALGKSAGHGIRLAPRLYRLFRELQPAIVHTRNLAALEASVPAWLARVPMRVHGEHGWDVADPGGVNRKNRLIRRLHRPFVTHYIALSADIERYLMQQVGIAPTRISHIYNGVDTTRFAPAGTRASIDGCPFGADCWLVGTVGRLAAVKDQATLVRAFARACALDANAEKAMRLAIVGDGPLKAMLEAQAASFGLTDRITFSGARSDIPGFMRSFDVFVLPSLNEGISNTILEAMATGLPVVAGRVGGNPELVVDGVTGRLYEPDVPNALEAALLPYLTDPALREVHGRAARDRVVHNFSLEAMVRRYLDLYDEILGPSPAPGG